MPGRSLFSRGYPPYHPALTFFSLGPASVRPPTCFSNPPMNAQLRLKPANRNAASPGNLNRAGRQHEAQSLRAEERWTFRGPSTLQSPSPVPTFADPSARCAGGSRAGVWAGTAGRSAERAGSGSRPRWGVCSASVPRRGLGAGWLTQRLGFATPGSALASVVAAEGGGPEETGSQTSAPGCPPASAWGGGRCSEPEMEVAVKDTPG